MFQQPDSLYVMLGKLPREERLVWLQQLVQIRKLPTTTRWDV